MENKKTVAERLREYEGEDLHCGADFFAIALTGEEARCQIRNCDTCRKRLASELADAIEAEQAELRERVDELNSTFIDLAALDLLCEKLDMSPDLRGIAEQIRAAMKPMKRPHEVDVDVDVIPDGIEWPRFEDGELVKFGDEVYIPECDKTGKVDKVHLYGEEFVIQVTTGDDWFCSPYESYGTPVKRPEPEVLDADGVPIKVGDTVYGVESGREVKVMNITADIQYSISTEDARGLKWRYEPKSITHRKPDTLESVVAEMLAICDTDEAGGTGFNSYFDRLRKLMGGE